MNHFSDKEGYNGIVATSTWRFRASQPPGDHPFGAYFTTLAPDTPNLAKRLGIPKRKLEYLFSFEDRGDLRPLQNKRGRLNKRGRWIFYSPQDYYVEEERQVYSGRTDQA